MQDDEQAVDLSRPGAVEAVMDGLNDVQLYVGMRVEGVTRVMADGQEVSPRYSQARRNHSPDGFNWGYGGSGPAQLALAILLREGLPDSLALELYQTFKWKYVARWNGDANWFLLGPELRSWIRAQLEPLVLDEQARKERGEHGPR